MYEKVATRSPEGGTQSIAREERGGVLVYACAESADKHIEEGMLVGNNIIVKKAHELSIELCVRLELNMKFIGLCTVLTAEGESGAVACGHTRKRC